jgi:hypothetical protein
MDNEITLEIAKSVIVPAIVSLFTVYIVHKFEQARARMESDEKLLREVFDRYVGALSETYEAMIECYDVLNRYANVLPNSQKEYNQKVRPAVEKWENTEQKNAFWLHSIEAHISSVRAAFRHTNLQISAKVSNPNYTININWQNLTDSYTSVKEAIRELIPVTHLEQRLKRITKNVPKT